MNRHTVGAGLMAAVVIACTGRGMDMMGGAMRDAGQAPSQAQVAASPMQAAGRVGT